MKSLGMLAMGATMALLLRSCFVLQGFSVLATSVRPRGSTKAQFVLHPRKLSRPLFGR